MKLFNKLTCFLSLSALLVGIMSQNTLASDTLFSQIITDDKILNAMPTKNNNENIYVTTKASVSMMTESSKNSNQIKIIPKNYHLTVLGAEFGWVNVKDDDGNIGYIYTTNLDFHNGKKPENLPPVDVVEEKGKQIVNFSKKYIGTPYVWGGTNLTAGVDCSGFVYSIYKNFGITLNRSSKAMYANNGVSVSKSNLKPGDLLFFNTSGSGVSHVGIYIGNGQYIHSSSPRVNIANLNSSYSSKTYIGAKRVLS